MIAGPHGGGPPPPAAVTTPLGTFRAEDYGAHSIQAGSVDASGGINAAIGAAAAQGGGVVTLDSGLEYDARRPIALAANVELVIPTGTTLKAAAGLVGDLVTATNAAGVRISGGGSIDANRAAGTTGNAVTFTGCTEPRLGVTVLNAWQDNVALVNCQRAALDLVVGAGGRHGLYHSGSTFGRGQVTARDNGQRVAGSGVVFDAASTDNGYGPLVSTDTRVGGAKTQQYGVLEVAASGCDRNTFAPSTLTGNAAGTLSLVGANSGTPLAPGAVTSAAIAAGAVGDAAIAAGGLHNASLAADVARANQLVNGGFEIWQRGAAFAANSAYTADRWQMAIAGTDLFSVSKDTTHTDNSGACAWLSFTIGNGGGASGLSQVLKIAEGSQLRGKTVSVSARVRTALGGNACRVLVGADGTGAVTGASAYHSGSGQYETLSASAAVPTDATLLTVTIQLFQGAATAFYVDNAMLVAGPVAADYAPPHPADDLARCMRYYETFGLDGLSGLGVRGYAGDANPQNSTLPFKAPKPVAPTVTIAGTWQVSGCGQPGVAAAGRSTIRWGPTSTGAGVFSCFDGASSTAGIIVEANP